MSITDSVDVSLLALARRYPWRVSFTIATVVVESALGALYPLIIGIAINDLIEDRYDGILWLAALGVATAVVGSLRRWVDTRIYAGIYRESVVRLVRAMRDRSADTARVSARVMLFRELIEFLEDSMPEIARTTIAIIMTLAIMFSLNLEVFAAGMMFLAVFAGVYASTARWNFKLNRGFNDQFERQIPAIENGRPRTLGAHFGRIAQWQIRLSDLETLNFLIIWIAAIALIVFTPISAVSADVVQYGFVLALMMYVFDYIDSVAMLPLHIQKLIRLREISDRLTKLE